MTELGGYSFNRGHLLLNAVLTAFVVHSPLLKSFGPSCLVLLDFSSQHPYLLGPWEAVNNRGMIPSLQKGSKGVDCAVENLRLDHQIPLSVHSPFISILWNLNFPGCVSPSFHLVLWVCEAVPKGWTQHEKGRSWDFPTVTILHWKVKESSIWDQGMGLEKLPALWRVPLQSSVYSTFIFSPHTFTQ